MTTLRDTDIHLLREIARKERILGHDEAKARLRKAGMMIYLGASKRWWITPKGQDLLAAFSSHNRPFSVQVRSYRDFPKAWCLERGYDYNTLIGAVRSFQRKELALDLKRAYPELTATKASFVLGGLHPSTVSYLWTSAGLHTPRKYGPPTGRSATKAELEHEARAKAARKAVREKHLRENPWDRNQTPQNS